MRTGAMWFVKDPQDQNAHPIRDILDRPTLTQLRKICVSGIMYSIVVACVVGSVAGLLLLGSKSIMPFRWKNRSAVKSPVFGLFLMLASQRAALKCTHRPSILASRVAAYNELF
jgi:E3 ubiquitin-protein ligase MARCH6